MRHTTSQPTPGVVSHMGSSNKLRTWRQIRGEEEDIQTGGTQVAPTNLSWQEWLESAQNINRIDMAFLILAGVALYPLFRHQEDQVKAMVQTMEGCIAIITVLKGLGVLGKVKQPNIPLEEQSDEPPEEQPDITQTARPREHTIWDDH